MESDSAALNPAEPQRPFRREVICTLGAIMGFTMVLHIMALWDYFLVDDWVNIRWLESPGQIWGVFTGNWMFGERMDPTGALYRPIPRLSFLLDRTIWGLEQPGGFHLTNLLLHGLNVFFIWGIGRSLWRQRSLAWLGALVFLAHPLTLEPAQWISGRTDLWVAVFSFPAIWITIAFAGERFSKHRFWTLLLMQLAFCSKETAAVLPALLLFIDLVRQRGWTRARVAWWAATLVLWVLYFLQRRWMFGEFVGYGMGERYAAPLAYVRNAYLATWLIIAPTSSVTVRWVLCILCVALVWFAGWSVARRRADWTLFIIPLAWFALAMAPLTTLGFSLTDNTRLLYPATAALCILGAGAVGSLEKIFNVKGPVCIAVAVMVPLAIVIATSGTAGAIGAASFDARRSVESIVAEFTRNPPTGTVVIETPPERRYGVIMFRTIDLPLAVEMILDERGVNHPPIFGRVQWENTPETERPEPVTTIIDFELLIRLPPRGNAEAQQWSRITRQEIGSGGLREEIGDLFHD